MDFCTASILACVYYQFVGLLNKLSKLCWISLAYSHSVCKNLIPIASDWFRHVYCLISTFHPLFSRSFYDFCFWDFFVYVCVSSQFCSWVSMFFVSQMGSDQNPPSADTWLGRDMWPRRHGWLRHFSPPPLFKVIMMRVELVWQSHILELSEKEEKWVKEKARILR